MYEGMEGVKKVQLEILLELDRICKQNNIRYQLCDGTLLGAVRHKGFIPWDDDIDVRMLRKDYNKFILACKEDLNKKYFLQNFNTDKNFPGNISSIRKNGTLQQMKLYSGLDMHQGIWIDIFPMDNILPDKYIGKLQRRVLYKFKMIKKIRNKNYAYNSRNNVLKCIKIIIHNVVRPISIQRLNKMQNYLVCMFEDMDTVYSTCLANGATNTESYYTNMVRNDEFYDIIEMEFEGHMLPVPRNYDQVLTNIFGDYMTLPPIEQQKPHHGVVEVSFNTTD